MEDEWSYLLFDTLINKILNGKQSVQEPIQLYNLSHTKTNNISFLNHLLMYENVGRDNLLECLFGIYDQFLEKIEELKENKNIVNMINMVIKALGFDPEDLPNLFDAKELQVTKWGTIKTDFDTMETNLKGVFAAGDIVRGASLVVWAIKDGRDAATEMKKYLESVEIKKSEVA